jgi:hypothetical protein
MNRLLMLAMIVLCAASVAQAGVIQDIIGGVVTEGSIVDIEGAIVTSVMNSSVTVSELPGGPGLSMWVIVGEMPTVSAGDVVTLRGTYIEHNGRSTISLLHPADAAMTVTGSTQPIPFYATVNDLVADPEGWESVVVMVTDGLVVQDIYPDGSWLVNSYESGTPLVLDDYFGLHPVVGAGECYNNALGLFFMFEGQHVLKALEVDFTDCTVGSELMDMGSLKSQYR